MDSILLEEQPSSHFNQQSISFQHNDTFLGANNEDGYTTLNDIGYYDIQDDDEDNNMNHLEEGEIDRTKLSFYNPLYKEIIPSIDNRFYKIFYNCLEGVNGEVKTRYHHMKNRIKKFFIQKQALERGQRWNKRIQPEYNHPSAHPLCYGVMLYGVDYLSNRDIKKILKLPKDFRGINRINWSNAAILFNSKAQLEESIKPHLFDNEKYPFFEPKQEEDLSQQFALPLKLPRSWYGLRPYEQKEEYIFWFVRYLTSIEPNLFVEMKQNIEFMEYYNASNKLWLKKTKEQEDFHFTSLTSSKFETIDRSQKERSVHMGSEPERRERSRQKSRGVASENFARSRVLSQLQSNNPNEKILSNHIDLNESYIEPMSFIYAPTNDMQVDAELKKRSDEIIMLMEELHVGGANTLESVKSQDIFDLDDDMAIVSDHYDPKGVNDCFFFDRKNKIAELTTLKPDEKFNYRDYTDKIMEAEEENKGKKAIPVICID